MPKSKRPRARTMKNRRDEERDFINRELEREYSKYELWESEDSFLRKTPISIHVIDLEVMDRISKDLYGVVDEYEEEVDRAIGDRLSFT